MYWQLKCVSIKISSCSESTLIIMTTQAGCQGLLKEENEEASREAQGSGLCASTAGGHKFDPQVGN